VTGTHGHKGLDHLLLGSVAERVIRHAPCSVLTVRRGLDVERFPAHLLVCTDFSAAAEPALDEAAFLARRFAARVTLCHVYDQAPSPLRRQARELRGLDDLDVAAALRQALERLGERFDGEVHHAILSGDDPAQVIAEQAGTSDADLVVVATHGRTGLSRMIIGSVAEKVARLAGRAVWIARTPAHHLVA
jgi:nucleotide-binding universal stress UspA family protein